MGEASEAPELTSPSFCSFVNAYPSGCTAQSQALCFGLCEYKEKSEWPPSGSQLGEVEPGLLIHSQNLPGHMFTVWGSAIGSDSKTFVFLFQSTSHVHNCSRASFRTKLRHKLLTKQLARVKQPINSAVIQQQFLVRLGTAY